MAIAEPRTPAPTKGNPTTSSKPWICAVLSERAVHHRKNDIKTLTTTAPINRHKRRIRRVGDHRDSLTRLENFRQHFLRARSD
jgi:hypothetical protein